MPTGYLEPLQAPEAVQAVAFVDDHVSVDPLLTMFEVGIAVRVTVGAGVETGAVVTVITADATLLVPPAPLQLIE